MADEAQASLLHQLSPLAYLFEWLNSGQDRESMDFNWSTVRQAVSLLKPEELEYLYNISGTNNTQQMLAVINSTRQPHIPLTDFLEYRISEFLQLYVPPVILAIGTLGNILSLVVLRSKPMVGVSSYTYLAFLAVTDTVVLYLGLLRIWLMVLTRHDYQAWSDWVCKVSTMFAYTASDLSVWLIIAVTVERYIVVCMPFRANSMCNVSRAKKVIGFLFGVILSINLHFLWTVKVNSFQEKKCSALDEFVGLVEVAWPWVDAFIYSFLPFIIITVLNILISREVMGAQSKRIQMAPTECNNGYFSTNSHSDIPQQQNPHRRQTASGEGTRLTIMLLTVSFTFLLLTLPVNILLIFTYYWNSSRSADPPQVSVATYKQFVRFQLIKAIIELLMYTNHSINFFLYCATGQKFRRQFLDLIRRCIHCKRRSNFNGFRFRRSTTRYSGSYLGGNSELTSSSRRRASSCVSFDMTDCSVRLDCSQNSSNYRDENSPLKDVNHDFPNNKDTHFKLNGSCSSGNLCAGGCGGCGDGEALPGFHQHYQNSRDSGQRHASKNASIELKPMLKDPSNRGRFFGTSSLPEDRQYCSLSLPPPTKQNNNQNHGIKPYKFNCKNVLKKSSCCHSKQASPNYSNGHSLAPPSSKRSCKIHFSSSKRKNNTASVEDQRLSNDHFSCGGFYVKHNTTPGPRREKGQAVPSFNTNHVDGGCCV